MDTSVFTYLDWTLSGDRKEVVFSFSLCKDSTSFPFKEHFKFEDPLPDTLEVYRLLRALHLASGISYYKIFFCEEIEHPYAMSTREANFWNSVFKNGLGEFMYNNKLDPEAIATFGAQEGHDTPVATRLELAPKALLGIGGGKDSIVAGELLKSLGVNLTGFVMTTKEVSGQTAEVAHTMHVPLKRIARTLDPNLLALQERPDAYHGHVPISLLFALVGCLQAMSSGTQYVVVANENSASIPQVEWEGTAVNHQWSKSFEFEKDLQGYLQRYVHEDLCYFSAIRPLSSVGVAKLFAGLNKYFTVFTSDNYVFRIDASKRPASRWSIGSPKSLSSFILLAAWLNEEELMRIFEYNFLDDDALAELFLQLLGVTGEHVLDCVGTPDELRASLQQAYEHGIFTDSKLMRTAIKKKLVNDKALAPTVDSFMKLRASQAFPDALKKPLTEALQKALERQI